jgi:pimeloyl-ACP methyl ester carboxylesterase
MSTASRLRCFVLACAAWTVFAPAPLLAHAWTAPKLELSTCPPAVSESIASAALSGVQCGHVDVPEHYSRARSKRLRVFVVIFKTAAQNPGTPVLMVTGGPGQALIWCSEELIIGSPEELDQRSARTDPIIQQTFVQGLRAEYEVCEVWPVPETSPLLYTPVISRVPTYIIGGALDPATAGDAGLRALRFLRNGQLSIIAAAGHLAAEQVACAPEVVAQFMAAPYARVNDSCLLQTVPFVE